MKGLDFPMNFHDLRKLSRQQGGFSSNNIRARLWPIILGRNNENIPFYQSYICLHRDNIQVLCDVERSLWHFNQVEEWTENHMKNRRDALHSIIMAILCRNPSLFYYQGFHDFISIFLVILNDDQLAFQLAEAACVNYLSDFMSENFEIISKIMYLILNIIETVDPPLFLFLKQSKIEPFFATSWFLTWFSHDIHNHSDLGRVFDALLCSHPSYILYLCVAVSCSSK